MAPPQKWSRHPVPYLEEIWYLQLRDTLYIIPVFTSFTVQIGEWFARLICLQLHGDVITSERDLVTAAKQLQETQTLSWQQLQDSFNQSLCLVSYLKTATL